MTTTYHGRLWNAPFTDDALPATEAFLEAAQGTECDFCHEPMYRGDDLLFLQHAAAHLECYLRAAVGDVQHLERRCLCYRGADSEITHESDQYATYRASARAALQWLIDNGLGGFHD